ncbi:Dysferlin, partial [Fasciola gigantica]
RAEVQQAVAAAGGAGGAGTDSGAFESDISAGVSFGDVTGDTSIATGTGVKRKQHEPYSTKADDYQIRVKIIEARQLQGGNITPICKVVCAGKNRETRVKSPTHSPYWDEIFFFNFHESPAKLFDQLIQFSVYNARKLRQDSLIGSFKFDLSLAYEQDNHALLNKWLLLSDPEDPMSGPRGYLKISLLILGPGDEPFSLKADDSDEQDIEANLLRPAVSTGAAEYLKLRTVQADGTYRKVKFMKSNLFLFLLCIAVPCDSVDPDTFGKMSLTSKEEKEYVDPYVEFSFAGTKIKSSKKYETANPEWNEEIVLNHQFPSMCEKLKFTIFDWDRVGNNDAVATGTILMSNISAFVQDDEGFLPTFGPCFINLYGSPREYSDMPNKYESLNLGKGDGAAYRGRVLLEVRTELLSDPVANEVRAIDNDSIARVQKVLRRRRFRVHAAFLSASLIPGEKDSPIQFEVSVGNYGNILDDSVPPCASTTPPTNPVYDGVAYSYLPWGEEKPMCLLESHWEDVTYRMCAVNVLLKAADRMTNSITRVQLSVKNDFPLEQQARDVIDALDQFILDCSVELPVSEPEQSPTNELDMHLRILREGQLKSLHDQAPQLSFPDVIIWMLSGSKRSAYCRIPAHDVMYHPNPNYCGRACGVPQTLMFKVS